MECALCLTEHPTLAVRSWDGSVDLREMAAGKEFGSALIHLLAELLDREAESDPLTLLRVTRGPANFTQLRTGLSCIRALGMARDIPVIAASVHEVYASVLNVGQASIDGRIGIVVRTGPRHWSIQRFENAQTLDDVPFRLDPDDHPDCDVIYGPDGAFSEHARHGFVERSLPPIDALSLFELKGDRRAYRDVQPYYVRPPDAVATQSALRNAG